MKLLICYSSALFVAIFSLSLLPIIVYPCCQKPCITRYEKLCTSCYHYNPSIDVVKKFEHALEVSLYYLAGNSKKSAIDKQTMKLIHEIDDLEPAIKVKLFFLANAIIRDAKTTKAYAH